MPKIKDDRIKKGKINRNNSIRKYFAKRFNDDKIRYEIIIEELILKYGLSVSTIEQIIKCYGNYNEID